MDIHSSQATARGVLESLSDQKLVFGVPGTDYQLHLVLTEPAAQLHAQPGKRVKGIINVKALRVFKSHGGGRFIEPIWGEPRIVAGIVTAIDEANQQLLVDVSVPMWMKLEARQPTELFHVGDLVNCYVASAATFTPV